MLLSSSIKMVILALVFMFSSYVTGQSTYNLNTQLCCNGNVLDVGNSGNTACCGTNTTYNPSVSQCCTPEYTVVPLINPANDSEELTCCAGQGQVVGYNQLCCNGVISTQPPAVYANAAFSCCDTTIITNRQSCCNGQVTDDANQIMGCCGDTFYDTTKSICCNNTNIIPVPTTSFSYNYGCCGIVGYDLTLQVCNYTSGVVYPKPSDTSCQNQYNQLCNNEILGPQQLCCNGLVFYPPEVWIPSQYVSDTGSLGYQAYCCPSGNGIIQDPTKETCCNNGAVPIDNSTQQCCGNTLYDPSAATCCNTTVVPGSGFNCCGNQAYTSSNQICCQNQLFQGGPNIGCCVANDITYYTV